ncbi:MAG: hypothetical protein ACW97P_13675 [Candidatus Hodarchaeales archaeon]|jgi:hypothetical protein
MKPLYLGRFNYKGEIHTLYRHAPTRLQAKEFMTIALAEKLGISPAPLRYYFLGLQDNFSIKKIEKEE